MTLNLTSDLFSRNWCISPIFFEIGIPNLVCKCILGCLSVTNYFWVTVTLTSDLIFKNHCVQSISAILFDVGIPNLGWWLTVIPLGMAEWCIPFWVTLTLTSGLISRFFVLYYSYLSSNVSYARPIPLGAFVTCLWHFLLQQFFNTCYLFLEMEPMFVMHNISIATDDDIIQFGNDVKIYTVNLSRAIIIWGNFLNWLEKTIVLDHNFCQILECWFGY